MISPEELKRQNLNNWLCVENPCIPSVRSTNWLATWYSFRYLIVRSLFCPINVIPGKLPFLGGKSTLDILIYLVLFAAAIVYALSDGVGAGSFAAIIGLAQVLIALKSNGLTFIFGISFERALFWHKLTGMILLAVSIIHGVASFSSFSGTSLTGVILVIAFGVTGLTYFLKPLGYEVFLACHICMYFVSFVFALLHGAKVFAFSIIPFAIDGIIRFSVSMRRQEAKFELLPCDVVRVTLPKCFEYSPGQYCFLMIPELTIFQFHPFTISSAPHENELQFHIRTLGDWTRHLKAYIQSKASQSNTVQNQSVSGDVMAQVTMPIVLEGPYGLPSIDINSDAYKVVVLIGGGIGVTPLLSFLKDLIEKHRNGLRNIRKCILIWSVRDLSMVTSIPFCTEAHAQMSELPFSLDEDLHSKEPFHAEVYSSMTSREEFGSVSALSVRNNAFYKEGRPRMSEVFRRISTFCAKEDISRVAVVGCGPKALINDIIGQCGTSHVVYDEQNKTQHRVSFDPHIEEFDF